MDKRLWICFIAVAVAMFALVWDFFYPFPVSQPILILCVGAYFFLMMFLTLYKTYWEKGIVIVALQKSPTFSGKPWVGKWEASSCLNKF